jgi:hypothetical protein
MLTHKLCLETRNPAAQIGTREMVCKLSDLIGTLSPKRVFPINSFPLFPVRLTRFCVPINRKLEAMNGPDDEMDVCCYGIALNCIFEKLYRTSVNVIFN